MADLKELQTDAKDLTLLYVEDNDALREKGGKLLSKFFSRVDLAKDGAEGLELFKKHPYSIVITDIKMPHMDGLTLAKQIHSASTESLIIIMSAFDDKKILLKSIKLGIFRFLTKPVNFTELSHVLAEAVRHIKLQERNTLLQTHLQNIFEHQNSMLVLLHENKVVMANKAFLDFFDFHSLQEPQEKMLQIDKKFLEHKGFLYSHDEINALEVIKFHPQKLYNVKMRDKNNAITHFIVKYQELPQQADYGVLSFTEISQLKLLKVFDERQNEIDTTLADTETLFDFLHVIQKNSAKVELHNYYNGLSITHDALITGITDGTLNVKTIYLQQKAIQIEQKTLIISNALPYAIEASQLEKINYEQQTVTLSDLKFVKTSPVTRKTIRVTPSGEYSVSLFIEDAKYDGELLIEDISLDAVKLNLKLLPAGLTETKEVRLEIVLELDKKPLTINTEATVLRKQENTDSFSVVFMFKDLQKSGLIKYITKRQMALIREIKGMQNE